ncbi:hypothetical protein ASD39_15810 [Sphingomonas sp. Root50]|nr:hypothetical protein ASD17_12610 [Sphingomonas sp. Root1294]KQY65580.1 hypothetical protein ASD39_15810 [Sphingomonas sp. Root50]
MLGDLIERIKAAASPDPALDADIAEALELRPLPRHDRFYRSARGEDLYLTKWLLPGGRAVDTFAGEFPEFTGSLDIAMSLVPKGWSYSLGSMMGLPLAERWRCHLRDHNDPNDSTRRWLDVDAAMPATSTTAACLKIRYQDLLQAAIAVSRRQPAKG